MEKQKRERKNRKLGRNKSDPLALAASNRPPDPRSSHRGLARSPSELAAKATKRHPSDLQDINNYGPSAKSRRLREAKRMAAGRVLTTTSCNISSSHGPSLVPAAPPVKKGLHRCPPLPIPMRSSRGIGGGVDWARAPGHSSVPAQRNRGMVADTVPDTVATNRLTTQHDPVLQDNIPNNGVACYGNNLTGEEGVVALEEEGLRAGIVQDSDLVEAMPVEEANLPEAERVHPELGIEHKGPCDARPCPGGRLVLTISILGLITVVLATVLGRAFGNTVPAGAPSSSVSTSTDMPTGSPSSAPTDHFGFQDLPLETWSALKDPFSPQAKALDWVSKYEDFFILPIWRKKQLFGMATFFYAFQGEQWPSQIRGNWLEYDTPECYWWSLRYSDFYQATNIEEAAFVGVNGGSDVCNDIGQLTHLSLAALPAGASLYSNGVVTPKMSLSIPVEISFLTEMYILQIIYCNLAGSVTTLSDLLPSVLSEMPNLREIDVSNNRLAASIPTLAIQRLQGYKGRLTMAGNSIVGSLPTEIGSLSRLRLLDFSSNSLSHTIPSEIGTMGALTWRLDLSGNNFSGAIPSEIGSLTNLLETLDLSSNLLSSTIPTDLGRLSNLSHGLSLSGNRAITGSLPSQLGLMTHLTKLDVSGLPLITGPLPSELGLMNRLRRLNLSGTPLSGSIPDTLCARAADNALEIVMPSDACNNGMKCCVVSSTTP